ncbi:hypothetical protein Bhyg_10131 [Pseudolycoriella hygida]|uniref:Uncharacterized protein n=1 Tax=Pseudolycoriella hygida TaxID=35572 RepID=A0A9Q0MSY7_9DIPT|nr:hypothetical protein Bhyg_10131 [Pseudolycoriella hygida]
MADYDYVWTRSYHHNNVSAINFQLIDLIYKMRHNCEWMEEYFVRTYLGRDAVYTGARATFTYTHLIGADPVLPKPI